MARLVGSKSPKRHSIENEIAQLRGLDLKGLQARWKIVFRKTAPPHLPRHLLFGVLAYRMQADAFGDLNAGTRYIGDAIMAYWGPPFIEETDQARLACLAAIDMMGRVGTLRKELPELLGVRSIPVECDVRVGIATGEALVGSIGSEFMMSYTVMGDTVNLASRLETASKTYGSRSLISEATVAATAGTIEVREIDRLVVVGQTQPQVVFEVMGRKGELMLEQISLRTRYSDGLAAYRARRWDEARRFFDAALEASPGDGPSMTLLNRVDSLQKHPPAADWDGSWHLDRK